MQEAVPRGWAESRADLGSPQGGWAEMRGWARANAPSLTLWVACRGGSSLPCLSSCTGLMMLMSPSPGGKRGSCRSWRPRNGTLRGGPLGGLPLHSESPLGPASGV